MCKNEIKWHFFDGNIKHNFYKKIVYIEYFTNTSKDMMVVLMCIEKLMEEHNELIGDMVNILNGFYESYVLDEDVIFKWYDSKSKTLNDDLAGKVRESARPFIEWLEVAEECSDEL